MGAQGQARVVLAWNPSLTADVTGYRVYCGVVSQSYTNVLSVGNVTNATLSGLAGGTTYFFAVTSVDSQGLESVYSSEISYTVPMTNTPPTISAIAGQTTTENMATPPIAFTVGDVQTPSSNLVVSVASSNPTLVPAGNIVLGGSGASRTVTVRPATNQIGTATITLTVSDGALSTSTSFLLLVVNPPPAITLSSPLDGSRYSAPATIALAANVVSNGHSITAVQFYAGANLVGQQLAAPYSFTWTNVSSGSYSLTAQATYDSSSTVTSPPAGITVMGLLPPWQTADIGSPGVTGSATISNGLYSIQGAGNINGSADNFRFLYQDLSGDGQVTARISSLQNTANGGCLGVMIREILTSGSRYGLMGISPNGTFRFQRRLNTSGSTAITKSGSGLPPNAWVRLVRAGNSLAGYKSADGTNWTLVNSSTIVMATNIYVGLAVASGSTTTLNTGTFANVTVVP